jgi:hypothetical protein
MADTVKGRDLPDRVPDLPIRPAEVGYGAVADDVGRGYVNVDTPPLAGDDRAGEIPLPTPKGFLYRGPFPIDR